MFFSNSIDKIIKNHSGQEMIIEVYKYLFELYKKGKISKRATIFMNTQDFEREVNNGGINQYFLNTEGKYIDSLESDFKEIGALKTAEIVKTAIDRYLNNLKSIETNYEDLDQKFYEYEDDLENLAIDYINKSKIELEKFD